MSDVSLHLGDCLEFMKTLPDASVDAVITDPPYAEISRPYGRLTESEWWTLMMGVCKECRRILTPVGSAMFILQANSRIVGSMRGWLFEFQAWVCREWNMVQDVWWWNFVTLPSIHSTERFGLMRPSVKACVWAGEPNCYRNQSEILWDIAEGTLAQSKVDRFYRKSKSGLVARRGTIVERAESRGGSTPFNILLCQNQDRSDEVVSANHSASSPIDVIDWWVRYISQVGATVLDPFMGSGTTGIVCAKTGRNFVGCEINTDYFAIAERRIANASTS